MNDLLTTIEEIVKYGLTPALTVADKEQLLERDLVKIYSLYFEINFEFDQKDYPDFIKPDSAGIRQNIESNFQDFGFYRSPTDLQDLENCGGILMGDAIDDLQDIIVYLMETRWRIENNSMADGLWFFQLMFRNHIKEHLLDLLWYMKQKNDKEKNIDS